MAKMTANNAKETTVDAAAAESGAHSVSSVHLSKTHSPPLFAMPRSASGADVTGQYEQSESVMHCSHGRLRH